MPFFDAIYAPYRVGETVWVIDSGHARYDQQGTVTRVEPPNAYYGDSAVYYVIFDGETEEHQESFGYWALCPTRDSKESEATDEKQ